MAYNAAVITISDKGSRGERVDTAGPACCGILKDHGWEIEYTAIIPDDFGTICSELKKCADELGVTLVITTGGTGFSKRDVTPEATLRVCEREIRGIPEAMRAESNKITPRGMLSRAAAGLRKDTMIVNVPGSEKAARENLEAVIDPIRHGADMLAGGGHDHAHEHEK
ncbi:MAG: MogA/MoaB family molybdenum cofactor biosynthesis protein [Anaerovoracaceae bacterium]|jgi:molybdopterin adenylyltransferase